MPLNPRPNRLAGTDRIGAAFRAAWITFALIPLWQLVMHLCRAGNLRSTGALQLIEVWDLAVPSLLLGISFLCLTGALAPGSRSAGDRGQ